MSSKKMTKKEVADLFASEFEGFMKQAWPECPRDGIQWKEQWKTFLGGAATTITVANQDPNAILLVTAVLYELAKQTVQLGNRN